MLDGRGDQLPRLTGVAVIERETTAVQQLVPLPLPFGNGAARTLDIRASPRMATIDEQHTRPDVDREFVLIGEVVGQTGEEQFLDTGVPIAFRHVSPGGWTVGS